MVKKIGLELLTIFLICAVLLLLKMTASQPTATPALHFDESVESVQVVEPLGLVDLNLATADELDSIPGIGPVIAERIVSDRAENGYYISYAQILRVKGIGQKKFAKMADYITLNQHNLIIYLGY